MEYSKLYNFEQPFSNIKRGKLQNNYNKGTSNHLIFNIVKDTTQKQNVKK